VRVDLGRLEQPDAVVVPQRLDGEAGGSREVSREFVGAAAVRRWAEREMVGDRVTIDVTEVLDHHGDTVVRGVYDGTFDRSKLPDQLILSNYFSVRDGRIVSLVVIRNEPAAY
jgi:hypothetical protein